MITKYWNYMNDIRWNSLPVYKNSLALRDLSGALANYFAPENKAITSKSVGLRTIIANSMATDASLIPITIEEACKSTSPNIQRKNATFIHIITRNIISYCNGLERDGVKEKEYIQLLRKELKTFRKSFKQWRKSLSNEPF